jgi:hypothetical protein
MAMTPEETVANRARQHKYREAHLEQSREREKNYREAHREQASAATRKWKLEHPEYYEQNRERIRDRDRKSHQKRREENPERILERESPNPPALAVGSSGKDTCII